MSKYYDGQIIERGNLRFRINIEDDQNASPPWENGDCYGVVSDWEYRNKKPCERILNSDRTAKRFYDVQASIKKAVDVWGCKPGKDAAEAVNKDFEHLRRFCADQWRYVGVIVTQIDDEDEPQDNDFQNALWGIESDCDDYIAEIADEFIDSLVSSHAEQLKTQYSLDLIVDKMVHP